MKRDQILYSIKDIASKVRLLENELKEKSEDKGYQKLVNSTENIVLDSVNLIDRWYMENVMVEKKVSKDSIFWAVGVFCLLFYIMGIFTGIGYMAVADLEECAYHGNCIQTPQGDK